MKNIHTNNTPVSTEPHSLAQELSAPTLEILSQTTQSNEKTLAHQRPDGVLGDWELIPREQWNKDQEIADATHGVATRASAISLAGLAITVKGLRDIYKGNYVKGGVEVAVGRSFDLWDGAEATKRGTRSKTGAAVDAGVDKALVATGATLLSKAGVVPESYAAATMAQEGRIFAENALIAKAGGEPNPSKMGKYRMFAVWAAFLGRTTETMLRHRGHEKAARAAGTVALGAEVTSLGIGEQAIRGYSKQRKALKK